MEVLVKNRFNSVRKKDEEFENNQLITEAMVTPSSSLVGNTIENVSFRYRYNCLVIGLQRKSRIITKMSNSTRAR